MSERTKLLKKAVLTSVGASSNVDRIKSALNEAMDDLVKVGQELLSDLEIKGKDKTDNAQTFIKNLQEEGMKRTKDLGSQVSSKAQVSVKKAAKEVGLVMREEYDELVERVNSLEELIAGGPSEGEDHDSKKKQRGGKKSSQSE
jgi:polyhydroxyalkanoate synthesis regulator phasin